MTVAASRRHLLAGLTGSLAMPGLARAQENWPNRPIKVVVPFATGGATDVSARIIAQKLTEILGQPVVVENRPGAGGTAGMDYVVKSAPDGYTFVMGSVSNTALAMGLYARLPYDPVRDLACVTPCVLAPLALVVRKELPVNTLQEFIALLKASPNRYSYGSAGNGSSGHISWVGFLQMTGTQATHVPYRGSGPVFNDLLAGVLDATIDVPGLIKPHTDSGALKALVMATRERSSVLPDVPTIVEAGLPDYKAYSWFGLFGPAGTPESIRAKLAEATQAAMADPVITRRLDNEMGLPPMRGYNPARFEEFLRSEIAYWTPLVRASGARAD